MKFLKSSLFIIAAVLVGLGVGVYRIANIKSGKGFFENGSWTGTKDLPLGKDRLITAQVTVFALFALPSKEAIYLFARQDEKKEKLNSTNDYTITGNVHYIKAKYWSITAYGKDMFLIPNAKDKYGFNKDNLETDSAGNFTIVMSHNPKPGNWLPTPENARFNLLFRIYKGEAAFLENLEHTALPEIKKAAP